MDSRGAFPCEQVRKFKGHFTSSNFEAGWSHRIDMFMGKPQDGLPILERVLKLYVKVHVSHNTLLTI